MNSFMAVCASIWRIYVLALVFLCTVLMYVLSLGTVRDVLRDSGPKTKTKDVKGWTTREE